MRVLRVVQSDTENDTQDTLQTGLCVSSICYHAFVTALGSQGTPPSAQQDHHKTGVATSAAPCPASERMPAALTVHTWLGASLWLALKGRLPHAPQARGIIAVYLRFSPPSTPLVAATNSSHPCSTQPAALGGVLIDDRVLGNAAMEGAQLVYVLDAEPGSLVPANAANHPPPAALAGNGGNSESSSGSNQGSCSALGAASAHGGSTLVRTGGALDQATTERQRLWALPHGHAELPCLPEGADVRAIGGPAVLDGGDPASSSVDPDALVHALDIRETPRMTGGTGTTTRIARTGTAAQQVPEADVASAGVAGAEAATSGQLPAGPVSAASKLPPAARWVHSAHRVMV